MNISPARANFPLDTDMGKTFHASQQRRNGTIGAIHKVLYHREIIQYFFSKLLRLIIVDVCFSTIVTL